MLANALSFLINTLISLLTFLLLLRFYMQWLKAPFQNPLGQMTLALTDLLVKPTRKWIPSWRKLDLSTLVLAFLAQFSMYVIIKLLLQPAAFVSTSWFTASLVAILKLISLSLDLFMYALLIQAVLSWVNPINPISGVLDALTRPILKPLRRWISPINGIDFSAFIAIILLQMVNISIIPELENHLNSIF